jgi:hypothetical protein
MRRPLLERDERSSGQSARRHPKTFDVSELVPDYQWYDNPYPRDRELIESFQAFAEGGDLSADYAAAECAITRTAETRQGNAEGERPSPASPLHRRAGVQAPKACSKAALNSGVEGPLNPQ